MGESGVGGHNQAVRSEKGEDRLWVGLRIPQFCRQHPRRPAESFHPTCSPDSKC